MSTPRSFSGTLVLRSRSGVHDFSQNDVPTFTAFNGTKVSLQKVRK